MSFPAPSGAGNKFALAVLQADAEHVPVRIDEPGQERTPLEIHDVRLEPHGAIDLRGQADGHDPPPFTATASTRGAASVDREIVRFDTFALAAS